MLQKDHIDSSSTTTFSEFFMNQNAIFFVFVSDGNNTVNKEIFGCNNDNYNNGFGAVILSVKMSMWRGFALAIPIRNWGIGCYIGQVENGSEFKWSKILTD